MYGNNFYGYTRYADNSIDKEEIKIYIPDLMKYLPNWYYRSNIMKMIQDSVAEELGRLSYSKKDLIDQFYVDTATWGLESIWEKTLGIETDLNKSFEERREVVKAKLRGAGTVTKVMLKNVSEAFSGGEVDVIENFSDYSFIIQFIGIKGIPKNMAGLKDMIETIKPAHLGYSFKYTYTVWDVLKDKLNWSSANKKTWNDLKIYE